MRSLTLTRILGRGAMGTTYAAELGTPEGPVPRAAKVMKSSGGDRAGFRERLEAQGQLLARAGVEGVRGIGEVVQVGDHDAILSQLLDGVSLGEICDEGALPVKAAAELGAALASRLEGLHACRPPLVHRDLKPSNVLVCPDGGVWLLDFGIAGAVYANREDRTQGLVLGTLNYFPPEVLAGGTPDERVDLYGLGILVLEAASGQTWGPPLVHRDRFQRRVSQRVEQLPADRAAIGAAITALLRWEPAERMAAGAARAAFEAAAAAAEGPGLAEWAADAVPGMQSVRRRPRPDDLVGRTLQLRGAKPEPRPATPAVDDQLPVPASGGGGGGNTMVAVAAAVVLLGLAAAIGVVAIAALGVVLYLTV